MGRGKGGGIVKDAGMYSRPKKSEMTLETIEESAMSGATIARLNQGCRVWVSLLEPVARASWVR